MVASELRYDLAAEDPDYVKELVQHHVSGYLKIAHEHSEEGPLSKMMNLALWLKANGFRADQVQAFNPSPMASATAMYHSKKDPHIELTIKQMMWPSRKAPFNDDCTKHSYVIMIQTVDL